MIRTRLIWLSLIIILVSSCASLTSNSGWIETEEGVKVWLSECDTTRNYSWSGNQFASIATGNGKFISVDQSGCQNSEDANAFWGALNESEIVSLNDGSKFIGNIEYDKMEGFGVLTKANELYIGKFHEGKPNGYLQLFKNKKIFYDGYWKDGIFNGKGTLYKEDGVIKSGEWNNGNLIQTLVDVQLPTGRYLGYAKNKKPDGLGQMNYSNGSTYKGQWKNGQWHGEGLYINQNDSIFAIWNKGKANGDAIYRTKDVFFEGTFIDNTPVGIGNLTTSDGTFYSGNWVDGKRDGMGDMLFANGDRFLGEWANNMFDGYGEYRYLDCKAVYKGDWKKGLQDGNGIYNCSEFTYDGQWEKGWMDGDGTLIFKNKDKYEGTIHENIIDGIGTYHYANGNIYEGEFVKGKITGLGLFRFKNGNRFEGEFYNGKIYGEGTMYLVNNKDTTCITGFWPIDGSFPKEASILFSNGDLYEGPIENGVPTSAGTWISSKERQAKINKVENSTIHKANELYKKHRETLNRCLLGASAMVTAIGVAAGPTPVALIAYGVNVCINVADARLAIASAAIDVAENAKLGEDNDEAIKQLETEVAMNAAFALIPKVISSAVKPLSKTVKNITRSTIASLATSGKFIAKKTAIKIIKGKVMGKIFRISVSTQSGIRKIEKELYRSKYTRNTMIAAGRLLTTAKKQTVKYSSYLNKIKKNPAIKEQLKMSAEGSSKNLGNNMRLCGIDTWVKQNERIRRYLGLPKRQVEPHHVIPSNPTTEIGRQARKIWTKYFDSVDHPCNGIWLGRSNKNYGYKALAKGVNHSPNSNQYEERVSNSLINTYKKYQKQYAKNPEMMQKVLAETVDNLKEQLYKGNIAIGTGSHQIHTWLSIFKESQAVVAQEANQIIQSVSHLKAQ